jgi:hypothetical protein
MHTLSFSRQALSEALYRSLPLKDGGRREDRAGAAPAVSCAFDALENPHASIQVQRKHSGLPCAMALRLISCSLAAMLCHHRAREALASWELDASTGASGPHDFAVRDMPSVHAQKTRGGNAAPTASRTQRSRRSLNAPSWGHGTAGIILVICGWSKIISENKKCCGEIAF